jgi:hypothetical protein
MLIFQAGRLHFGLAIAVALLIGLCSAREPAAADKFALWANRDGPHLRGANLYQRKVYPELDGPTFMGGGSFGPPVTQVDLDRLAAFGANLVVISHPGLYTERPPYHLDAAVKANLDRLLESALAADLFAVIAFRTGPGRSEFTFMVDEVGDWFDAGYLNDRVWGDAAAQAGWVAMWRETAQAYRGHPAVVGYLLMVEPNSSEVGSDALNALDEWDAAAFQERYGGTGYDWNQLHPPITAAIREVDPDTPILIGGNGYSAVDWLDFVTPTGDSRTVYIAHQYAPAEYTHQYPDAGLGYPGRLDSDGDGGAEAFDRDALATLFASFDRFTSRTGAPVAVTEFGVHRWAPGAERFLADEMDLLESRGMNHALWEWQGSYREFTQEVNAFNFRFGPDPASATDVSSSGLIEVVRRHWGRNQRRPSNTAF